ncbi:MAG: Chaperone protein DnaJ [Mycoplasmataceae bacterium]|nr:MAG: Chaperone protein DnaJ [Mycoplasmataceae bacterium]
MTKEFYQILEVNENATFEDVKKSYRKLATQWHPDKWANKTIGEREQANKKMQELNEAYEVLGDEEKRRRYDLGVTDFADNSSYRYDLEEEIKRQKAESMRRAEDIEKAKLEILNRHSTINEIGIAFFSTSPQIYEKDLDSSLWQPYQTWAEKVTKMKIVASQGKNRNEELKSFKEEMIEAIKEAENFLRIKEEKKKKDENDVELNQAKTVAFQSIEKYLKDKKVKIENLGQYSNYQEKINSLGEVWEINNFREEIISFIIKLSKRGNNERRDNADLRKNFHNSYPAEQLNYQSSSDFNFSNNNPEFREKLDLQPKPINPNSFLVKSNFSNQEQNEFYNREVAYSVQCNPYKEKVKKISQLWGEIEWLKKNKPTFLYSLFKPNECQKKLAEKEKELSELIASDCEIKFENTHSEDDFLIKRNQRLEKEVRELKFEVQNLKDQKNNKNKFEHQASSSEMR